MFLLLLAAIVVLIILPLTVSFSLYSLRYLRYSREEVANTARLNVISAKKMTEMYQDTIAQAATLVLIDPLLGEIASIRHLDDVRASFDAYQRLNRAVSLLTSMTYIGSLQIDSAYLYFDDADYIISSDRGAVRLSEFPDRGYRDVFEELARNPHSSIWLARKVPVPTISRDTVEMAAYITYANMANPIVSKVGGAIFVNIRETVFSDLTNTSEFDKGGHTFIVDPSGVVLCHVDKTRILGDPSEGRGILRLLGEGDGRVATAPARGQTRESLYVSAYSADTSWTFVSEHSLDALTTRIRRLMRRSILVIFVITLVGSSVVVYISSRISIPLQKLIRSLSQWNPGGGKPRIANEFEYLLESFQRIRENEATLHHRIEKSRDRLWESYIVDVLRGDLDKHAEDPFPESQVVPEGGVLRVLTVSMDHRSEVESRLSQEQRSSYLSLLSAECEKVFAPRFRCVAALIDANVSVILGSGEGEGASVEEITSAVAAIQGRFADMLGTTLTVGISGCHEADLPAVSRAYVESTGAVARRMIEGYGKVHLWQRPSEGESRYPSEAEAELLGSLRAGDLPGVEAALGMFFSPVADMAYEDIIRSVDQLCATLAAFMREGGIRHADAGTRGMFDDMARRETLAEKKSLIADICRIIVVETRSGAATLVERMLEYVGARYTTTIDFEAMAHEVGISYSYMRRLMKEHTGRSILEHVHHLRVEEAGRLLGNGNATISAIARNLGYNNIQSFERFFRKHKGVSAQEYRKLSRGRASL